MAFGKDQTRGTTNLHRIWIACCHPVHQTCHQRYHLMKPNQQAEPVQNDRAFRTAFIEDTAEWFNHTDFRLTVERYDELDQFLEKNFSSGQEPELILLFQAFSDQYSPRAIYRLFEKHPLSRILVAYGPYCESDGRTRRLWPQTVRVPLWKLSQRIEREIEVLSGKIPTLPLTATAEEIVHFEYASFPGCSPAPSDSLPTVDSSTAQAVIFSPDSCWAETLRETFAALYRFHHNTLRTLGSLGDFFQANPDYCGQIFFDLDPYRRAIRNWLDEFLIDSGKNYIARSGRSPAEPIASVSPGKKPPSFPAKTDNSAKAVVHPEQIVAVTNWLTPHCRRELEQFGINRLACKLNLPGILAAASK